MRPKGKLFALFAVFAAIGLVTASGAFTTVQAERTAEVNVAGDANALLALEPDSKSNNADEYVNNVSGEDTIEIVLESDQTSAGVNNNAVTEVDRVFNITNQGTQSIDVFIVRNGDNQQAVTFYDGLATTGSNITADSPDQSPSVSDLGAGDTVRVSMTIDTTNVNVDSSSQLLSDITIYANASNPQDSTT